MTVGKLKISPELNIGHLLTATVILAGLIGQWFTLKSALDVHAQRIMTIESSLPTLAASAQVAEIASSRLVLLEQMARDQQATNARILEQLGAIREQVAGIRAAQPPRDTANR